jgi:hypothetical protein
MHADGMLPGRYRVSVRCAGYVSHDRYPVIELRDHDITGLVWEVDAGAAIQGRVVTSWGAPIGGVYVSASMVRGAARAKDGWSSDISSADGSFALAGLVPGRYRVEASASSHIGPKDGWLIDVAAGAQLTKQLVIEDGGSIKGLVVDAHDKPVGSVHVRAAGAAERSARTNADGTFELDGLRPGDYTVVAMHAWWSGALRKPGSNDDDRQGNKVAVAAGRASSSSWRHSPASSPAVSSTRAAGPSRTHSYLQRANRMPRARSARASLPPAGRGMNGRRCRAWMARSS